MTLQQLTYFCAVCRYHSIVRAAKALYISQPTISTAIHELEKEFLSILEEYKGNCPVYIFIKQEKQYKNMGRGFMVDGASGIVDRLKLEYGVSRVTVRSNKKK